MNRLNVKETRNTEALYSYDKKGVLMKKEVYEAPTVITFGDQALSSVLGPSLSCTGFGGSAIC